MRLDVCSIGIGIDVKTIWDRESSGGQTGKTHALATNQVQICIRDSKGEYMFFRHFLLSVQNGFEWFCFTSLFPGVYQTGEE